MRAHVHLFPAARDACAGRWTEWRNFGPNGTTVGFANARLSRVGRRPLPDNVDTTTQAELEALSAERPAA